MASCRKTPCLALPCLALPPVLASPRFALQFPPPKSPTRPLNQNARIIYITRKSISSLYHPKTTYVTYSTYVVDSRNRIHFPSFSHDMIPIESSFLFFFIRKKKTRNQRTYKRTNSSSSRITIFVKFSHNEMNKKVDINSQHPAEKFQELRVVELGL